MTTLPGRRNTALLVIDVQNGIVANAHNRDGVVANINPLIDKTRAEGVPEVWVQHSDDHVPWGPDSWQYVPELARRDSEPLVHNVTLVGDAHTTEDLSEYGAPPPDKVMAHTKSLLGGAERTRAPRRHRRHGEYQLRGGDAG